MKATSKYHIANLAMAAAMQNARKEILEVVCSSPAGLKVLADFYANIRRDRHPLDEEVHIYARRIADDPEIAEDVARARAATLVGDCLDLVEQSKDSTLARKKLIDDMLDTRLPDKVIEDIPEYAVKRKYCSSHDAKKMTLKNTGAHNRLHAAKAQMVEANLPLIGRFLYAFHERPDYEDIYSEGVIGLMRAVERWDSESGFRLSTYAHNYVLGNALNYIEDHGSTIRIPNNVHPQLNKVHNIETRTLALNGFLPSPDSIAREMDIPVHKVRELMRMKRDDRLFEHSELRHINVANRSYAQMQMSGEEVLASAYIQERTRALNVVLATLTRRQETVTRMRFGLGTKAGEDYEEEYTFKEVGREFNLSGDRIRQIESKALRELRYPYRARWLKPFALD